MSSETKENLDWEEEEKERIREMQRRSSSRNRELEDRQKLLNATMERLHQLLDYNTDSDSDHEPPHPKKVKPKKVDKPIKQQKVIEPQPEPERKSPLKRKNKFKIFKPPPIDAKVVEKPPFKPYPEHNGIPVIFDVELPLPKETIILGRGRVKYLYPDGTSSLRFPDQSMRISRGKCIFLHHSNGDREQIFPDSAKAYFYEDTGVYEFDFPDGNKIILFPSGQVEIHMSNGNISIRYPDGTETSVNIHALPGGKAPLVQNPF